MIDDKACNPDATAGYENGNDASNKETTGGAFNSRLAYRLSSVTLLLFCCVILLVQGLRPSNVLVTPISVYLSGPYSGWLRTAFYLVSVATVLFGALLNDTFRSRWSRLSLVLLAVCALGIAMTAFTQSPWALQPNLESFEFSRWHVASAVTAFVAGLLVMIGVTVALWRVESVKGSRALLAVLTASTLLALALDPVLLPVHGGLEKLAIVTMIGWQSVTARCLAQYSAPIAYGPSQAERN